MIGLTRPERARLASLARETAGAVGLAALFGVVAVAQYARHVCREAVREWRGR